MQLSPCYIPNQATRPELQLASMLYTCLSGNQVCSQRDSKKAATWLISCSIWQDISSRYHWSITRAVLHFVVFQWSKPPPKLPVKFVCFWKGTCGVDISRRKSFRKLVSRCRWSQFRCSYNSFILWHRLLRWLQVCIFDSPAPDGIQSRHLQPHVLPLSLPQLTETRFVSRSLICGLNSEVWPT